jgi:hypothetical protein
MVRVLLTLVGRVIVMIIATTARATTTRAERQTEGVRTADHALEAEVTKLEATQV